jgi:hypothetical protein
MWSSFKIMIEDYCSFIVWWQHWLFTIFKELKKKNKKKNFLVTITAIFHKRPGLATISLEMDHICIISVKFGGN